MDEFLKDIYIDCFKQWILYKKSTKCQIDLAEDQNMIYIYTQYSKSTIMFYKTNIIEFSTINLKNNNTEFYLHFQFQTMKHAMELFNEMFKTIQELIDKPILKVLLSCTSGLTTGYFSDRINEVIKLLMLDIEVHAISYNHLYAVAHDYDMIMLAPQISYMYVKTCEVLKNQIVLKIPPTIFAKYDVAKMLSFIEKEKCSRNIEVIGKCKEPTVFLPFGKEKFCI